MRILLVTHIYPPAVDGGSKVIAKIGQYFQKQGHQILVLTTNCTSTDDFVSPNSKKYLSSKPNLLRLPVYQHWRRPLKLINLVFKSDLLRVFQKGPIFKTIPFIRAIITITRFRPQLIIAGPLPTTIVIYARLIHSLLSALSSLHSILSPLHSKLYPLPPHPILLLNASFHPSDPDFHRQPLINTLKKTDYLWTLTYFHHQFGIPIKKMINVGNGVDQSLLIKGLPSSREDDRRTGGFNLLFIGSFAAHKGLLTLLEAFDKISPSYPKLTLTLAGQPTLFFPNIQQKINSLPATTQSRIEIISNFSDSQLPVLIDNCQILISPSTQESFGLVLLEAWARNKPVIAANIPASLELISKSHGGLLFNPNDSVDLSDKITSLLNDPQAQRHYGRNGYQFVKHHATWDRIGELLWQKISSSLS